MSLVQPPVQLADGDLERLLLHMYRDIIPITEAYFWRMTIDG
jgi:hypothetical protein